MQTSIWNAALTACLCAGAWLPATADYAPLHYPGRVWVYQGIGTVQPTLGPSMGILDRTHVKYRERLQLKVLGPHPTDTSVVWRVEERDSLFARLRYKLTGLYQDSLIDSLKDTVSVRVLEYEEIAGNITLIHGDSLAFGHRNSPDLFFASHSDAPSPNTPITGVSVSGAKEYTLRPNMGRDPWVQGKAWYIDNRGLYWAKLGVSCGQCGCMGSRELRLETFAGFPVDIGRDPPGSALAKDARIACGLFRPGPRGRGFAARRGEAAADAIGRRLRIEPLR